MYIPVGLPSSQIKICGKLVKGFLSYDRTNKQRVHRVGTDNLQRKGEQYLGKRGVLHSWEHYTHRTFLTFMECILKDLSITIYHVQITLIAYFKFCEYTLFSLIKGVYKINVRGGGGKGPKICSYIWQSILILFILSQVDMYDVYSTHYIQSSQSTLNQAPKMLKS